MKKSLVENSEMQGGDGYAHPVEKERAFKFWQPLENCNLGLGNQTGHYPGIAICMAINGISIVIGGSQAVLTPECRRVLQMRGKLLKLMLGPQ